MISGGCIIRRAQDSILNVCGPFNSEVQIWNPGGTSILGHIRNVRPEWVSFPGQKPADGCKCLTKNLRMGHNVDVILPENE